MAMLAEPRRRQKWSVDPRNSAWSKDESKFGQRMLERMGWSKGKGLGKSEQGDTEHIKVKVKNDNLGLGTTASHEDNWIAHQDDFDKLLAELNNCHGQNTPQVPQEQSFSLVEKSKTSKKRVHYMKFTKGKDLSCRSQTDMACIFGKRAQRGPHLEQEDGSSESSEQEAAVTPDPEVEASINTVTSSLSMQEYFAQRMSRLRRQQAPSSAPSAAPLCHSTVTDTAEHAPDTTPPHHAPDPSTAQKTKSKKKKRKMREQREEEGGEMEASVISHEAEQQSSVVSKKKKKKRRRKCADGEMEREGSGAESAGVSLEDPADPAPTGERRKRGEEELKAKKTESEKRTEECAGV
ncbi:hypothetical protein GJAV_G00107450 [Gymnothorax javanicus]|nr:hypothetical protein GJAV_G00107450 [Gymnothorax javanicus]